MPAQIPIHVIHYTRLPERRRYIEAAAAASTLRDAFDIQFVTEFDREDLDIASIYRFDEDAYKRAVRPVKDILIGYVIGLHQATDRPFKECVDQHAARGVALEAEFDASPWLRPRALRANEVSVLKKHRAAWERIAAGDAPWAVIAEDDILFSKRSLFRLHDLMDKLPVDADYIDIAGGCGLVPRAGNTMVNQFFYQVDPPRDRTACCALVRRHFIQQLLALDPPLCIPIDWLLTWAFTALHSKVYWVEPTIFGHGSELNVYQSTNQP